MSTLSRPHIGRDHPRLRGEQFKTAALSGSPLGSPPLARGTEMRGHFGAESMGITPACAGNSLLWPRTCRPWWDHPRLRGEQVKRKEGRSKMEGSPPLARGTEMRGHFGAESMGITPACAGNSLLWPRTCRPWWDHPRLRGEQPSRRYADAVQIGSPPLARGTGIVLRALRARYRITPACAGNRPHSLSAASASRDHPRLRGEQMLHAVTCAQQRGSPPLARGTD